MHVQIDNSTVNKNTGAIVIAVIEVNRLIIFERITVLIQALILVGIVVFILYRNFSAAGRRRTANAGGGWPGNDTNDVVTFENHGEKWTSFFRRTEIRPFTINHIRIDQ